MLSKWIVLSMILLGAAHALAGDGHIRRAADATLIPDRYIVVFSKDIGLTRGSVAAVSTLGETLTNTYGGRVSRQYAHALQAVVIRANENVAQAIAADPRVAYVEQDAIAHLSGTQSSAPWGVDRVDQTALPLNNTYSWDFDGSGVRAYVLDSGVRHTHDDFDGRASFGTNCTTENNNDNLGHGSHVAGLLGGETYGVAKNVSLISVKVCKANNTCPLSDIICGVDYVTLQKQNNPSIPMVANMSLGGSQSTSMDSAVEDSVDEGVFYAVSAGNDNGADACTKSPAGEPSAYTVGATDMDDDRSSFSNIGTCVDIFAPGDTMESVGHLSDTDTDDKAGTSMAAPHVAGAAALILDEHPTWTPAQVRAELNSRATAGVVGNRGSGSPDRLLFTRATPLIESLTLEFTRCVGARPDYLISWQSPSGGILEYDADYRWASQPWSSLYSGGATSTTKILQSALVYHVRVRARNASGWGDFKERTITSHDCRGGGGGGGTPQAPQ